MEEDNSTWLWRIGLCHHHPPPTVVATLAVAIVTKIPMTKILVIIAILVVITIKDKADKVEMVVVSIIEEQRSQMYRRILIWL